jgi:DNA-binding NarL/FixJ family response regulator
MTTMTLPAPMPAPGRVLGEPRRGDLLDQLSARELEVLALMAEGRSNRAIGEQLTVALKTVEAHVSRVFTKLGLNEERYGNRRVLAVLAFLGREGAGEPMRLVARSGDESLPGRPMVA